MTKHDLPPEGLNWNLTQDQPSDQPSEEGAEERASEVKGVFDSRNLAAVPPPVGRKGLPLSIPMPPGPSGSESEGEDELVDEEEEATDLAELISDSLRNEETTAPLAAFDSVDEPFTFSDGPSPQAVEQSARDAFGSNPPEPLVPDELSGDAGAQPDDAEGLKGGEGDLAGSDKATSREPRPLSAVLEAVLAANPEVPSASKSGQRGPGEGATADDPDKGLAAKPIDLAALSEQDSPDTGAKFAAPAPEARTSEIEPEAERRGRGALGRLAAIMLLALAGGAVAVFTGMVRLPFGLIPAARPSSQDAAPDGARRTPAGARAPGKPAAAPPVKPSPPAAAAEKALPAAGKPQAATPPLSKKPSTATVKPGPIPAERAAAVEKPAEPTGKSAPQQPAGRPDPAVKAEPARTEPAEAERDQSVAAMLSQARKLATRGDEQGAEELFRAVLQQEPDEHHAMEGLVRILLKRKQGQEALPFAKRIVRKRARRASYRLLYGDALDLTGDRAGAEKQWKEALRISPDNTAARLRLP